MSRRGRERARAFFSHPWLLALLLMGTPSFVSARVVINEIFYDAPDDIEQLEFVELFNSGDTAVDLSGWAFTKGIKFTLPAGTRIEANGFLVLCRNQQRFLEFFDAPVAGTFDQNLSNQGEKLELSNARGKMVDAVKYASTPPWPLGAAGASGSLERICPGARSDDPFNWTSSPLSKDRLKPTGTPGRVNANFSAEPLPVISEVKFTPEFPTPDQPVAVEVSVSDPNAIAEMKLLYRLAGPGFEKAESAVPMKLIAAGKYAAEIPGQVAGQLIRFRAQAAGVNGAQRFFPSETEPRPALSAYVSAPFEPAKIPFGWIIHTVESEFKEAQQRTQRGAPRGPGGPGGAGGPGRGGFGPGMRFAPQTLSQADKNTDQKVSAQEFTALAETWFNKLDPDSVGTVSQEEFIEGFNSILPPPAGFGPPGGQRGGGQRGADRRAGEPMDLGPGMFLGPPFFQAADANKDGSLTREEWKTTMAKWFTEWDGDKSGTLDEAQLRTGWNAVLPMPRFGPADEGGGPGNFRDKFKSPSRGATSSRSALVYFDPAVGQLQLFDFVEAGLRAGGHKVHLHKGAALNRMNTLNLFYDNDRAVLAEPLAYEVYRRAGMPAPQSHHVRVWVDGQPAGFHLLVEQVNNAFLHRNKLPGGGNLYKLLWYESGVAGQHEKKTNTRGSHDDIAALVAALEKLQGDAAWEFIQASFDVNEVATYFASCLALSNWDGFFNNYFAYHDPKGGKWMMFPWDQDQTWGIAPMQDAGEIFYNMPATFGMEGDQPPGGRRGRGGPGFGPGGGGGAAWWRPGGYFSKPLLANPQFRQLFLARTRQLLETVYTEATFNTLIDALGDKLRPEVQLQAELQQRDPARALESFGKNLQGFRDHLKKRREFLLAQDEIKRVTALPSK